MLRLPLLLLAAVLPLAVQALELHVSPKGDDQASGGIDAPLASLDGARRVVRDLPRPLTEPVRVVFAAGTYRVTDSVDFDEMDSGEEGKPITYEAGAGAEVIISGGMELPPFSPGQDGRWTLAIPAGTETFEQLWVSDRRAIRARTSRPGTRFIKSVESEGPIPGALPVPGFTEQVIRVDPKELSCFRKLIPDEAQDAVATFYHKWDSTRSRVESVDIPKGTLKVRGPAQKANTSFDYLTGMVIENVPSLLDEPGEWFLSREGQLTYLPRVGESMDASRGTYPVAEKLVTIKGKPHAKVAHLAFRGIRFRHAKGIPSVATSIPNQAVVRTVDGVITLEHASQIAFTGCELSHVGSYGFSLRKGCRQVAIEKCLITDLGAGGVKVGSLNEEENPDNHASHNRIHNNIIRDGGLIFPCAVGVWIGSSSDNEVTHNEISDFYYTGVSVGWIWGYKPSNAKRNKVEWNHIHHLGKGLLSDMGGVYTLGLSEGTTISHNLIHDVMCFMYGGWGIYADEGTTGISIEGNVIHDTTDGGFHQNYGKENNLRNNVFGFAEEHQLKRTRDEAHRSFTFEKNIIVFDRGELIGMTKWTGAGANFLNKENIYWDYSGRPVSFTYNKLSLADWKKLGHDIGSRIADPLFVDPTKRDFRLKPGSPALAMGIKSINVSEMGVLHDDPKWRRQAMTFDRGPKMARHPRPADPPVNIRQGFEGEISDPKFPFPFAVSALTRNFTSPDLPPEGLGDALCLTNSLQAKGRQSLLFKDAPKLPAQHYPMLYFEPRHRNGTSSVSFDLYLEPKAIFTHEWRTKDVPCHIGPVLRIKNGRLTGPKGINMTLPNHKWIRFELKARIGDSATGSWDLKVTAEGEASKEFPRLAFKNPDVRTLDWVGFISDANEKTAFYLDELSILTDSPDAVDR
jgi:hypothetical protein